jgi:hypothetical protein
MALAIPQIASATEWGSYYLSEPCCNGDPIQGTIASLTVNSISPATGYCESFAAFSEDAGNALLQAGIVKCVNTTGGCTTPQNSIQKYVEVIDTSANEHCYMHGTASTGTEYVPSVQNVSGNTWDSFISGTAYETNSFNVALIKESAEYTGSSCSGWSGKGTYAADSTWPFQRYVQATRTWKTVQSAWTQQECWVVSGSLPGSFTISH